MYILLLRNFNGVLHLCVLLAWCEAAAIVERAGFSNKQRIHLLLDFIILSSFVNNLD